MESQENYIIRTASSEDYKYLPDITKEMALSAAERKVNKGSRTPEYIATKMMMGLAVIAIHPQNGDWMGFAYIEVWQHEKFIANSGLIVSPKYRGNGICKGIKKELFKYSRTKFPEAKLLSLTTNPAVIHVNNDLGYKTVSCHQILNDQLFLEGRNSWIDYVELMQKKEKGTQYVAMVYEP